MLLWRAFYRFIPEHTAPEKRSPHVTYKAVSTSLTLDQAKLSWQYAVTFTESRRFKPFLGDVVYSPFPTLTLYTRNENNERVKSEVWARSLAKGGLYLLGHSLGFVLADECAYIPKYLQIEDEVLRMRLADQGGALMRISTPNGRNFFFQLYQSGLTGDPRYYSHRITTWENPYVSKKFIEEMRERMLPEYYAQNVMAEFVSLSDFFKLEHIQALYEGQEWVIPRPPEEGAKYVMGVDLGAARDPSVVIVWRVDEQHDEHGNLKPMPVVFVGSMRNANWRVSREFVKRTYETYKPVYTTIDATGVGAPVAQQLVQEDGLENTELFIISPSSKPDLLVRLQDAVQRKKFVFPFCQATRELVDQMGFYRLDDKDISQDFVIALALTNWSYEKWVLGRQVNTEIYTDLAFIDHRRGGQMVSGTDMYGPGTIFSLDAKTGLFLPSGYKEEGDEEWDF